MPPKKRKYSNLYAGGNLTPLSVIPKEIPGRAIMFDKAQQFFSFYVPARDVWPVKYDKEYQESDKIYGPEAAYMQRGGFLKGKPQYANPMWVPVGAMTDGKARGNANISSATEIRRMLIKGARQYGHRVKRVDPRVIQYIQQKGAQEIIDAAQGIIKSFHKVEKQKRKGYRSKIIDWAHAVHYHNSVAEKKKKNDIEKPRFMRQSDMSSSSSSDSSDFEADSDSDSDSNDFAGPKPELPKASFKVPELPSEREARKKQKRKEIESDDSDENDSSESPVISEIKKYVDKQLKNNGIEPEPEKEKAEQSKFDKFKSYLTPTNIASAATAVGTLATVATGLTLSGKKLYDKFKKQGYATKEQRTRFIREGKASGLSNSEINNLLKYFRFAPVDDGEPFFKGIPGSSNSGFNSPNNSQNNSPFNSQNNSPFNSQNSSPFNSQNSSPFNSPNNSPNNSPSLSRSGSLSSLESESPPQPLSKLRRLKDFFSKPNNNKSSTEQINIPLDSTKHPYDNMSIRSASSVFGVFKPRVASESIPPRPINFNKSTPSRIFQTGEFDSSDIFENDEYNPAVKEMVSELENSNSSRKIIPQVMNEVVENGNDGIEKAENSIKKIGASVQNMISELIKPKSNKPVAQQEEDISEKKNEEEDDFEDVNVEYEIPEPGKVDNEPEQENPFISPSDQIISKRITASSPFKGISSAVTNRIQLLKNRMIQAKEHESKLNPPVVIQPLEEITSPQSLNDAAFVVLSKLKSLSIAAAELTRQRIVLFASGRESAETDQARDKYAYEIKKLALTLKEVVLKKNETRDDWMRTTMGKNHGFAPFDHQLTAFLFHLGHKELTVEINSWLGDSSNSIVLTVGPFLESVSRMNNRLDNYFAEFPGPAFWEGLEEQRQKTIKAGGIIIFPSDGILTTIVKETLTPYENSVPPDIRNDIGQIPRPQLFNYLPKTYERLIRLTCIFSEFVVSRGILPPKNYLPGFIPQQLTIDIQEQANEIMKIATDALEFDHSIPLPDDILQLQNIMKKEIEYVSALLSEYLEYDDFDKVYSIGTFAVFMAGRTLIVDGYATLMKLYQSIFFKNRVVLEGGQPSGIIVSQSMDGAPSAILVPEGIPSHDQTVEKIVIGGNEDESEDNMSIVQNSEINDSTEKHVPIGENSSDESTESMTMSKLGPSELESTDYDISSQIIPNPNPNIEDEIGDEWKNASTFFDKKDNPPVVSNPTGRQ